MGRKTNMVNLIRSKDTAKDLALLIRKEYRDELADPDFLDDDEYLDRLESEINELALQWTMGAKETDMLDASILWQAKDAQETGWHFRNEHDTVEELLASVADGKSQTFCSQISGLLTVAFPMMRNHGYSEEYIDDISRNALTRARNLVPAFRACSGINDRDSQKKRLEQILEALESGSDIDELNGNKPEPFEIQVFEVGGGKSYALIEINNPIQRRALELALKGMSKFQLSDYATIKNLFKFKE